MISDALADLKTEQFKDSAEAVIPASFPPVSYTYDPLGNITSKTAGPTTLGYAYHPQKKHAVNSINVNGAPYAFDYDNNGNMTNGYDLTNPGSIVPRSMTWNADNMPTVVTRNGSSTTLSYDGEGTRVKKVGPSGTTYYIGDHFEVSNNDPTKYIFAGNLRIAKVSSATGTYYFHKDHLGSSSAMTTTLGSVQEETNYMPFGEQREHTGLTLSNYKFTDQELDPETGLYNYGARLYDAVTGRFVSADTIVPDFSNPQSLNRYSYTLNNPLIYVDPTGHLPAGTGGDYDYFTTSYYSTGYSIADYTVMPILNGINNMCGYTLNLGLNAVGLIDEGKNWLIKDVLGGNQTDVAAVDAALMYFGAGASQLSAARSSVNAAMRAEISAAGALGREASSSVATSATSAVRLRNQLSAQEIAGGHAFEKHVLQRGEFPEIGTRAQFATRIEAVMNSPEHAAPLTQGRSYYYNESINTLVVRNPYAMDGGSAYRIDLIKYPDPLSYIRNVLR